MRKFWLSIAQGIVIGIIAGILGLHGLVWLGFIIAANALTVIFGWPLVAKWTGWDI